MFAIHRFLQADRLVVLDEKEEQRKADVRAWAQKRFGDNADIAYRIICDGAGVRAL